MANKSNRRGRPREFDLLVRLPVTRDQHRLVEMFAETNEVTTAGAYRRLVEIALNELEGAQHGV